MNKTRRTQKSGDFTIYALAAVLFVLWVLGLVCHCTLGGAIHLLIIATAVLVVGRQISNQKQGFLSKQQRPSKESNSGTGKQKIWNLN